MTPSDWIVEDIEELFHFYRTTALSRSQLSEEGAIGYIHYGDIHAKWGTHLNVSEHELPRVDSTVASSATRVQNGDLVLADASEDLEGVGRAVEISGVVDHEIIAGLHTVLMRPRPDTFAPGFVGFLPRCREFQAQSKTLAAGLKVYGLSKTSLRQIRVSVPPLSEQREIAAALSDADALVDSLDALIAKKRDMKQAAIRQLLSGRTRLPGFADEWEQTSIGAYAQISKGKGLSREAVAESAHYPCLLYGELFTTYGRVTRDVVSHTNVNDGVLSERGDVLMPGSTTTSGADLATATALLLDGVRLGGDINVIRPNPKRVDSRFLAYLVNAELRAEVSKRAQGITIHHLYGKEIAEIEVRVPSLDEQRMIADVCEDLDFEIDALVAQREKAELVKQGMMQELLSGRVRLV